ncbi:MAG: hypothetical protein HN731_03365 [Rhodospirillaceae bacterium]|jgi:hypothetical protein|nr:hypothetical protein [Rhodospirillaceae bacterium]MBT7954202.1 hypothetical protein [Rhodospirillaceae bacterium]
MNVEEQHFNQVNANEGIVRSLIYLIGESKRIGWKTLACKLSVVVQEEFEESPDSPPTNL